MASSTPDVKALFNSAPYVSRVPEQEEEDEDNFYAGSTYVNSSSIWNPRSGRGVSLSSNHGLPPPGRVPGTDDAYKRGSDSTLESKMRENLLAASSSARSLTTRAQSLDLTSLSFPSRSTSSSINNSNTVPISETPDRQSSPTDSITNPSPPTSAMIPSFPSVYGPAGGGMVVGSNKPRRPVGMNATGGEVEDMLSKFRLGDSNGR